MIAHHFHNLNGEQKDQLLVTCDKTGKSLTIATRNECHKGKGIPHLAFMAFVIDGQKNIILTKRSRKKSLWAGFWDASVVSHVLPGETVEQAAQRRGKEELGRDIQFKEIGAFYYFAKHGVSAENEYCHVLVGVIENEVYTNPVEIKELKKISPSDLLEEIKKERKHFTPWLLLALKEFDLQKYV